jgi:hypothetical protein
VTLHAVVDAESFTLLPRRDWMAVQGSTLGRQGCLVLPSQRAHVMSKVCGMLLQGEQTSRE